MQFADDHTALQELQQYNSLGMQMAHPGYAQYGPPQQAQQQTQYAPHDVTMQQQANFHATSEGPSDLQMQQHNIHHMPHAADAMSQVGQTATDGEGRPRKSGAGATAANEKELRELIDSNGHRSLESIAKDVRSAERTQKAERAKQLFAMRWLKQFCKQDKESVPRSKVYTHYTQRCGTERVDTLNPASFGKLVRVIFPGIATRRLGVRGESKYHYVNLTLIEDPHAVLLRQPSVQASMLGERDTPFEGDQRPGSRMLADSAAFPPAEPTYVPFQQGPIVSNPASESRLFAEPNVPDFHHGGDGPQMYTQTLQFAPGIDDTLQTKGLTLPSIHQYLGPGIDPDIADNLGALYRTHCTSLIDSFQFVKERQFIKHLASFNGTMTVPVTKLFEHPAAATWIKACDWYMYQQIIKFVSKLALQVIPPQVFTMLGNIANNLTTHIKTFFKQRPDHVRQAKLEPATRFASLLKRTLRVNETAHAAANLLTNDEMRNMMWQDWIRCVRPKRVLESELPSCGHQETYQILTSEVRQLLEPLNATELEESGTEFEGSSLRSIERYDGITPTAENVMERWAIFCRALPTRFPKVATRALLHYICGVSTATLRDITVHQASSFGGWWITKVWVDEMMLWLAETGGFLDSTPPQPQSVSPQQSEVVDGFLDRLQSRAATAAAAGLGIDFQAMPNFAPSNEHARHSTAPPTATCKYTISSSCERATEHLLMQSTVKFASHTKEQDGLHFDFNDYHDDSALGMSTNSAMGGNVAMEHYMHQNTQIAG